MADDPKPEAHEPTVITPDVAEGPFTLQSLVMFMAQPQPTAHLQRMWDHTNNVAVLALTLDGEGRGESILGRTAIGWTVRNRVEGLGPKADRGEKYSAVCLRRLQYSCWWELGGVENYKRTLRMAEALARRVPETIPAAGYRRYTESQFLAVGIMTGQLLDPTHGATHYCTKDLFFSNPPKWTKGAVMAAQLGSHVFFKGVR